MRDKHNGPFRGKAFFIDMVFLFGPEALEFILMDKTRSFSAEQGYRHVFGNLVDTSLLLMDFDEHQRHRKSINPAFKMTVMKDYILRMNSIISERFHEWEKDHRFKFYPAVKQLTLDVATSVFLGINDQNQQRDINRALTDLLASPLGIIRLPIPGTRFHRGMKAKTFIDTLLREQIPSKRASEETDIFTQLCQSTDEDGNAFSDDEIVDHLITFWVAGHDTLASSLTTLAHKLGEMPEWQTKLRDEINSLDLQGRTPTLDDLKKLALCGYAFDEALRFMPPAVNIPRVTLKDVVFDGYHIPKGMHVSVGMVELHHNEANWPNPDEFDPMRFAAENKPANQHRFAWSPFGGGVHKCIGMNFAQIQAKLFLINLLGTYSIILPDNYQPNIRVLPTPQPKDGLPITLERVTT